MPPHKINSYLSILGNSHEYANLFAVAHQLYENQLLFSQFIPKQLTPHCKLGHVSGDKLIVLAESSAIASKLKQIFPSVLMKLRQCGWEVTSFQISVQANHFTRNSPLLATSGYKKKKAKLSNAGRNCLNQLVISLPQSELRDAIQSLSEKHQSNEFK